MKKALEYDLPGLLYLVQKIGQDYTAYLLSCLSAIIFALSFIYPNQHKFSAPQTTLIRSYTYIIFSIFLARYYQYPLDFKNSKDFRNVCIRNLIILFYTITFTASQFYIPLPIAFTINSIGPIFVWIVDYIINKAKINKKQILGTILGFLGILLVINGNLISKWKNPDFQFYSTFQNYKSSSFYQLFIVYFFLLLSNFLWAYAAVITKQCISNSIQINFNLGIIYALGSWFIYPFFQKQHAGLYLTNIFYGFLLIGIPMVFSQFTYISALKLTKKTGNITILGFLSLVTSYCISIFRYGEQLNLICILGTILTVLGVLRVVFSKQVQK